VPRKPGGTGSGHTSDRCDVLMLDLSKVRLLDFRVSLNGCRVFLQRGFQVNHRFEPLTIELLGIGKFDAGQEVGRFRGIEVRVDRDEHGVRIALGKFDVAGRDLDHIRSVTIPARLRRRTQIAPTNMLD
jgi:hypothetical protein